MRAPHKVSTAASKVPAEAALSFLKDTKSVVTWSVRDLAALLRLGRQEAEQVIALLEAQGYVRRASGTQQWMTTPAGESVSGAKPPRFSPENVKTALDSLRQQIKQINRDSNQAFRITEAVAFGDFLLPGRTRVQAADVGIRLVPAGSTASGPSTASDAKAERAFLKQIRGRSPLLNIRPYSEWMQHRSHLDLLKTK